MARRQARTEADLLAEIESLRRDNAELQSRLKTPVSPPTRTRRSFWKTLGIICTTALATTLLLSGSFLFWAARSIVETDNYVETVGTLVDRPEIQEAIATKATDEVFERVDVASLAEEALPPRAAFLAGPLEDQVESRTKNFFLDVVSSDRFDTVWTSTQRQAHTQLMELIKSDTAASGVINIDGIYASLNEDLAGSRLSVLANRDIPDKIGQIEVISSDRLATANFIVTNLSWLRLVAVLGFVALTIITIALATNRRTALIKLSIIYSTALLCMFFALRIVQGNIGETLDPLYTPAFDAAWDTVFSGFVAQLTILVVLFLGIAAIAWLGGPSRAAASGRARMQQLLSGKLHTSVFGDTSPAWTLHIAKRRHAIRVAIAGAALVFLVLAPVTTGRLLGTAIVALIGLVVLEFIAGSPKELSSPTEMKRIDDEYQKN